MLTNALLLKISLALAALLALATLWYHQYQQDALERARAAQIEQQVVRRHPTPEQIEQARRINHDQMTGEGLARARKHFLETLGGKK